MDYSKISDKKDGGCETDGKTKHEIKAMIEDADEAIKELNAKNLPVYRIYFVTCNTGNNGIQVHTDINFELTKSDIFINPLTGLLVVNYVFQGKVNTSKTSYNMSFNDIQIEEYKL